MIFFPVVHYSRSMELNTDRLTSGLKFGGHMKAFERFIALCNHLSLLSWGLFPEVAPMEMIGCSFLF